MASRRNRKPLNYEPVQNPCERCKAPMLKATFYDDKDQPGRRVAATICVQCGASATWEAHELVTTADALKASIAINAMGRQVTT